MIFLLQLLQLDVYLILSADCLFTRLVVLRIDMSEPAHFIKEHAHLLLRAPGIAAPLVVASAPEIAAEAARLGLEALMRVGNNPSLKHLPFELETPNDLAGYAAEIKQIRELAE